MGCYTSKCEKKSKSLPPNGQPRKYRIYHDVWYFKLADSKNIEGKYRQLIIKFAHRSTVHVIYFIIFIAVQTW
jgi:hypothetical protein